MKQSRQARKPAIREPLPLAAYLAEHPGGTLLAPWERAERLRRAGEGRNSAQILRP